MPCFIGSRYILPVHKSQIQIVVIYRRLITYLEVKYVYFICGYKIQDIWKPYPLKRQEKNAS